MTRSHTLGLVAMSLSLAAPGCGGAPPVRHDLHANDVVAVAAPDPDAAPPVLRLPADVHPLGYTLDLRVLPGEPRFSGTVAIRVRLDRPRQTIWLHGHGLHVTAAKVGDTVATYTEVPGENEEGLASLHVDAPVAAGETTLSFTYDVAFGTGGDAVFHVEEDGRHYAFTQFEPISARNSWPCFDEPGFKTPWDVSLTIRKEEVAVANTPATGEDAVDATTKRIRFQTTEPLPTYLVAFAVGPLDIVDAPPVPPTDERATPLPLRGVAMHGKGPRLAYELAHVAPIVQALERYFGSAFPYPKLDVIAIVDFPGAMENAGAVTFDEWLLLVDPATASEDQLRYAENTIAHELSHQWFGDLVTMAWWDDLWLNEAFATWMANKIVQDVRPALNPDANRIAEWSEAMDADSHASARRIRQPIVSHHDINSAFDSITYSKGSAVIAMFEHWVGTETWQRGVRAHLAAHRYGSATADDLLGAVSQAANQDVTTPFHTFLDQPGAPIVTMNVHPLDAGHVTVDLASARFRPIGSTAGEGSGWQIPVCVGGSAFPADRPENCVLMTSATQTASFPSPADALTMFLPNAGGVGYYQSTVRPETLLRTALAGQLAQREAASIVASYEAGFDDGSVHAADVLAALAPLATRPEPLLARAPISLVEWSHDRVADDALRPRIETWSQHLYAPAMRRLGWQPRRGVTEDGETKLLRAAVVGFLVRVARDPAVRREAVRRGRLFVGYGGDGHMHADAVVPDLAETSLAAAVEEGDAAFFDAVLAQLGNTDDPALRDTLISSLAAAQDPALADRARGLMLDPRLSPTEVLVPLRTQLHDRRQREAAWTFFKTNFDGIMARLPSFSGGYVPHVVGVFCDAQHRADAESSFAPRAQATPGAPQSLAEALEQIDLCAARVVAQGDSARQFFAH